jgi:hypothetical protein
MLKQPLFSTAPNEIWNAKSKPPGPNVCLFLFFSKNSGDRDNEGVQASALARGGRCKPSHSCLELRKDGYPSIRAHGGAVNEGQKVC